MQNFRYILYFQLVLWCAILIACEPTYYSATDFSTVPKVDAHFHYNTYNARYLQFADSLHFRLISPNVDTEMAIDSQLNISTALKQQFPDRFYFLGTFSVDGFKNEHFSDLITERINRCVNAGASGIKIWKNIGMELRDDSGHFVMADDPRFASIFKYLEANSIPVLAHLGEPRNCWLPEEQMTLDNDRRYYRNHPEYHMLKHPEAPSYQAQIDARDHLFSLYPDLQLAGAHLGSMEWSVDEIARHLDQFPNFVVDMSARIGHLQYHTMLDKQKVRQFMIKYQDRILYGTDMTISDDGRTEVTVCNGLKKRWMEQWTFLATSDSVTVADLGGKRVSGLQLPRTVIDKIFCKNAERFFKLK